MVLGWYGQRVYGMYSINPENTGTGTILACLLGCILGNGLITLSISSAFRIPTYLCSV